MQSDAPLEITTKNGQGEAEARSGGSRLAGEVDEIPTSNLQRSSKFQTNQTYRPAPMTFASLSQSARGQAQSKTCRKYRRCEDSARFLDCACPLALLSTLRNRTPKPCSLATSIITRRILGQGQKGQVEVKQQRRE